MRSGRSRWVLVLLALALVLILGARVARAQSTEVDVEVRVAAQRLADGRTEFALQERAADGSWDDRRLPARRFFPANARVGRWLSSSPLTVEAQSDGIKTASEAGVEVRVAAQRLADGRMEFALQERESDGSWADRRLPARRFFPANARVGRWLSSSPLTVRVAAPAASRPTPSSPENCVLADNVEEVITATFQVQVGGGRGTAFYIGNGEWVTNHHVVEEVDSLSLVHGDMSLRAAVVGSLPDYDLALLRAEPPPEVPALEFVNTRPRVGSDLFVVGFPAYVVVIPSVTDGVVSRHAPFEIVGYLSGAGGVVIQTNADINPGNSGGPIVDDCGSVAGVATFKFFTAADGRDLEGIGFGIAAETVLAQLTKLRASPHVIDSPQASTVTIKAFCTYPSSEDLDVDECHNRARSLDTRHGQWNVWAEGVVEFANLVYRVDGGAHFLQAEMSDALLALDAGCYELEIAESGISTHWSLPYEFCMVSSEPPRTAPQTPAGLRVTKIDIPLAPDHIRVDWEAVSGATWYEVYHRSAGPRFDHEATVTVPTYLDQWPNILYLDSYIVRACNASGCSPFSAAVTEN